jgi:hypothetical protein
MAQNSPVVLEGMLKPDGTLELDGRPALPPGRVRVRLELVGAGAQGAERLPDPPWPDESIPAPFDLPRPPQAERVQARKVPQPLPGPFVWNDEAAA